MGVPVGVRANLSLALARGTLRRRPRLRARPAEPLVPRSARDATRSASPPSSRPSGSRYPPGKSQRERLLGRIDALLALSEAVARRGGASASPATTASSRPGVDPALLRAAREKRRLIVVEWRPGERAVARARAAGAARAARLGARAPADEAAHRPARRSRASCATACTCGRPRRAEPRGAPRRGGDLRARLRTASRAWRSRRARPGSPIAEPPGLPRQPELAAAAARAPRGERRAPGAARAARAEPPREGQGFALGRARARRALPDPGRAGAAPPARVDATPLADRDWIVCDLHMHTVVVARLRDRDRGSPRPRRGDRPRRDRGHRPQRLRRRARGRRARAGTAI